jgi:hypothetical protein
MAEAVKKSVAIGIAGITAVVVAAWRQIQRDNTISTETGPATAPAPPKPAPRSREQASEAPAASASPDALFTPSVSEKSTKAELYEVASELEIEGRSKMNKSQLLDAIRAAS